MITLNDFSSMLGLTLLNNDSFDKFNDINTDLSNRILNERANFYSFESFIEKLQSKNYTYSRISRTLMYYKTSTGDIKKLLDNWLYCDSIYRLVYMNKSGKYMPTEFNYKIIII